MQHGAFTSYHCYGTHFNLNMHCKFVLTDIMHTCIHMKFCVFNVYRYAFEISNYVGKGNKRRNRVKKKNYFFEVEGGRGETFSER